MSKRITLQEARELVRKQAKEAELRRQQWREEEAVIEQKFREMEK